ncbi:neuronal acetylcholine receptor subunit beta-3-like [Ptychodera flava]|uniref:neuronal acetylcholine receptor subunit beta-3-like n=1 Tax=Ptychodera flava TaxID=63121 RepID=UPI00396A5BCD
MLLITTLFLVHFHILIVENSFLVAGSREEKRLHSYLFDNGYNKNVRPVERFNQTLELQFGLMLRQVFDVDENKQIIRTSCWAEHEWVDHNLRWDPANFSWIEYLIVPYESIWKPDIALDNSLSGQHTIPSLSAVTLAYDGTVYYTPPAIFETPCPMSTRYFPFDVQTCQLNFGPWEHTTDLILMTAKNDFVGRENYIENSEWDFRNSTVKAYGEALPSEPEDEYSLVVCTLVLKRRPLYYIVNIVLPCLILALLTLMVLSLPPESGEKMSFGVSLLIALSVFNLLVAEIIPPTSDSVPLMVQFLLFNLVLVASSIIVSVLVLRLHHRQPYQLCMGPCFEKFFIKFLPKLLCMGSYPGLEAGANRVGIQDSTASLNSQDDRYTNKAFESNHNIRNGRPRISSPGINRERETNLQGYMIEEKFSRKILDELTYLRGRVDKQQEDERLLAEWRFVAKVIDRLFIRLALIAYLTGAIFLYTDPNLNIEL